MFRTLKYFFVLGLLILLTLFAINQTGTVTFKSENYNIQTSLEFFSGICLCSFAFLYFMIRGYQNIRGIPLFIERYFQKRNLKSGIDSLEKTIRLFEAQEYADMARCAEQVEKFLPTRMLGLYYKTMAKHYIRDFTDRESHLRELMQKEEGAFVAAKLLSELNVKKKNIPEGIEWAKKAHETDRKSPWALKQLLNLTALEKDYENARKYLNQLHTLKKVTPDFYNHAEAVLLYQKAKTLKPDEKISLLEKSNRSDPEFIPTINLLIKEYLNDGKKSRAQHLIETTWSITPHPSLVPFYLTLFDDPGSDEVFKAQHLQRLVSFNPQNSIGLIEAAKIFMKAKLWGQARDYLRRIPEARQTQGVLKLMAELEIEETGNHENAEKILTRLPQAPLDKSYECESCEFLTQKWNITCPSCGNFGRLKY